MAVDFELNEIGSSDNTFSFLLDTHSSISNGVIYIWPLHEDQMVTLNSTQNYRREFVNT